jgi:transcriptional regulator
MRHNDAFALTDPDVVRDLVRDNPWATIVSHNEGETVASHYPILLDEEAEELSILTHLGRPDEEIHGIGEDEILCIVEGTHGYVSPSWYPPGESHVPTWNFSAAHCYGVPELLDEVENLAVLTKLVERFERQVSEPHFLDPAYGARIAKGTVGIRVPISRFVCKRKLSQNKDPATRRRVIAALREPGPYHHPRLADEMERVDGGPSGDRDDSGAG